MPQNQCQEHQNPAQMLCIYPECNKRLMCLLCDHQHELFTSILKPNQINYSKFKEFLDLQIDKSFQLEMENKNIEKQKELIHNYYENIKNEFSKMIAKKEQENIKMLASNSNSDMSVLKHARIKSTYHNLPPKLFEFALKVYEGEDLKKIVFEQEKLQLEKTYEFMSEINSKIDELFACFNYRFQVKPPQLTKIENSKLERPKFISDDYIEEEVSGKLRIKFKTKSQSEFASILTDCHSDNRQILTTSYDKTLRVFDKKLQQVQSKEYTNILNKLCPIDNEVYAIAMSKQLFIQKISQENSYNPETLLKLKGHNQRINDLHAFNSRIVGSSSDEGLKIWDLYKQKCEYTLKDKSNASCFRFLPSLKNICIGYHNHEVKIYSMETMQIIRLYQAQGLPLFINQENTNENLFYLSGFPSNFGVIDVRLSKLPFNQDFKSEAISTFKESIFREDSLLLGERGGKCRIFDMRKRKTNFEWEGHEGKTNLSKPNGVIKIFEENASEILTVGCNDRVVKIWEIQKY